mmetsp:Transcript_38984/g.125254  ORF Transcript_38984/g.125254 Transcript_38984/m.125254 type:complete len:292 (+) Transcript_38984:117-992(+)|eukprot:CAMPEP_0203967600 /NCGR_PEP_ID=MMETSP0359-20131031/96526_1 /ASSEMBLY_ACC=CAM_ASM_000338 /TAXON_ID=268821 /ORGANISM="Scrippsiella Hangoei, Strain SHTV-5" /LENGTH=291 /DNA_ID=CAMNT_0050905515 /DNA_START=117 /DNA_END=992 /DNA_ORIENTATION=-
MAQPRRTLILPPAVLRQEATQVYGVSPCIASVVNQQQLTSRGSVSAAVLQANPATTSHSISPKERRRRVSRHVWFNSPMNSYVDITPYSQVYGMHPRFFDFDGSGSMLPAQQPLVPLVPQQLNGPIHYRCASVPPSFQYLCARSVSATSVAASSAIGPVRTQVFSSVGSPGPYVVQTSQMAAHGLATPASAPEGVSCVTLIASSTVPGGVRMSTAPSSAWLAAPVQSQELPRAAVPMPVALGPRRAVCTDGVFHGMATNVSVVASAPRTGCGSPPVPQKCAPQVRRSLGGA